ncbi:MAG: DUF308 domain-containing protein [Clostridia bacterium]|nr:DUF308 domain-containing protein [Clostridia bacterium]
MKNIWKKMKSSWIACAVATILVGLVLVLFPGETLKIINYLLGALSIVMGILRVVRYFRQDHTYPFLFQSDLVVGLIAIGLGLFLMTRAEAVLSMIPFLFGLLLAGCGVGSVLRAADAKRAGIRSWAVLLGLAILTIIAGAVILFNPFTALEISVIVIGACLIYQGVHDIAVVLLVGKRIEAWRKARAQE